MRSVERRGILPKGLKTVRVELARNPFLSDNARPEINLAEVRLLTQHVEPVAIRNGDYEVDEHHQPS